MIGTSMFDYSNNDIRALIRKDLTDKFGTRELSGIDMSAPEVINITSKVTSFPNPTIEKISVEQQLLDLKLPIKPTIPRADASIKQNLDKTGGDNIVYTFDRVLNTLTIAGGPVLWSEGASVVQNKSGHWVGVSIAWPLGLTLTQGQVIPFTLNSKPCFLAIDAAAVESKTVTLYFDAAYTTNELVFNWSESYEPEKINVVITATLQDSAVRKIPAFPTEPIFNFKLPQQAEFCPADVKVHVDLSYGK